MSPDNATDTLASLSGEERKDVLDFLSSSTRPLGPRETMEALRASILFKWRAKTRRVS